LSQLEELSLTNNKLAEPELAFENIKEISIIGHNSSISLT